MQNHKTGNVSVLRLILLTADRTSDEKILYIIKKFVQTGDGLLFYSLPSGCIIFSVRGAVVKYNAFLIVFY